MTATRGPLESAAHQSLLAGISTWGCGEVTSPRHHHTGAAIKLNCSDNRIHAVEQAPVDGLGTTGRALSDTASGIKEAFHCGSNQVQWVLCLLVQVAPHLGADILGNVVPAGSSSYQREAVRQVSTQQSHVLVCRQLSSYSSVSCSSNRRGSRQQSASPSPRTDTLVLNAAATCFLPVLVRGDEDVQWR